MGLFDGDFDMSALSDMLNPMGTAQAGGLGPNGVPQGMPSEEDLQAFAAKQGLGGAMPPDSAIVPRQVQTVPITPTPPVLTPPGGPLRLQSPEQLAAQRAADANVAGVGGGGIPPAQPVVGGPVPPPPGAAPKAIDDTVTDAAVGAALTGKPTNPMDAKAQQGAKLAEGLAAGLKGVASPPVPQPQKISSPSVPRPAGNIKAGNLQALLQAINAVGQRPIPGLGGRA
jgi:hypothetical protein